MTARERLNAVEDRARWAEPHTRDCGCVTCQSQQDVPALVAALRAVLEVHAPMRIYDVCDHTDRDDCGAWETVYGEFVCGTPVDRVCETCRDESGEHVGYPCPTVAPIDAHLGGAA